jgi:hypothetical protein
MERRRFLESTAAGLAGAGLSLNPASAQPGPGFIALEWFRCRRDQDVQRLRTFLGNALVPAYNRAGGKPVGVLQTSVGPDSPSFLTVTQYPSMAAIQDAAQKLQRDEQWSADLLKLDENWELSYDRLESSLLRGFRSFPRIETPKIADPARTNLFELRMYESRNVTAHLRKIAMFDAGEIDIFRRVGIQPVFFGTTLFGQDMPNLVYMVYFPTWEARRDAWAKFGEDPDWKKISSMPGNSDRELVSRISNQLMTPLAGSQLK